jgi:proline iminopeptidase
MCVSMQQVHLDEEKLALTLQDPRKFAPFALFECLFFKDGGYLSSPTQLLDNCDRISHIPTALIHGRQDIVCRPSAAWLLHKKLPLSTMEFIPNAGHSDSEIGTEAALVRAADAMKAVS